VATFLPFCTRAATEWHCAGRQAVTVIGLVDQHMTAKRTILVVDDSAEILALFRDLLEAEGFRVLVSAYTLRQLDTIVAEKPDLVILDLTVGREFTGWQTLQMMRMHPATAKIAVIICTAELQRVSTTQGYLTEHGVRVLLKPFEAPQLLTEVRIAFQGNERVAL